METKNKKGKEEYGSVEQIGEVNVQAPARAGRYAKFGT